MLTKKSVKKHQNNTFEKKIVRVTNIQFSLSFSTLKVTIFCGTALLVNTTEINLINLDIQGTSKIFK